jgi:hypothetical protein
MPASDEGTENIDPASGLRKNHNVRVKQSFMVFRSGSAELYWVARVLLEQH